MLDIRNPWHGCKNVIEGFTTRLFIIQIIDKFSLNIGRKGQY